MEKILVPLDFSENSSKVLAAAKYIASKTGSGLILLHIYQPFIPDVSTPANITTLPVYEEIEKDLRTKLDELVDTTRNEGISVEGIIELGGVETEVHHKAKELAVDLIVTGRSGKGSFLDRLIGTAATGIALHSSCPVLVIPPQFEPSEFKNILYATQLEYDENHVLKQLFTLANDLSAHVSFVKINALEQPDIQEDKQFVEQIINEFGVDAINIVTRSAGSVRAGIQNYADEIHADLLVVSTRERGFLEEFLIAPSITKKLVAKAHLPLLVYHLSE